MATNDHAADVPEEETLTELGRGSVVFTVDSQLIGELGEKLVTRKYVALSELIKNSYDADSERVDLWLTSTENDKTKEFALSRIVVKDTGSGMTLDQITRFWMKIATSHKRFKPVSEKYGRPITGNKGVGRFACQKLAERLVLRTISEEPTGLFATIVYFRWDQFTAGTSVDTVRCRYRRFQVSKRKTGLTLKLLGIRERWTKRDIQMLLKSVALVSVAKPDKRRGYEADPGFKVHVHGNPLGEKTQSADIGQKILEGGWGTLTGAVDEQGTLKLLLRHKDAKNPKTYEEHGLAELAGLSFVVHMIPGSSRTGIENRRDPSLLTQRVREEIWKTQSGIRMYLNNFRVYPYGDLDSGDDWLGIAADIARRRGSPDPLLEKIGRELGFFDGRLGTTFNRAMLNQPGIRSHIGSVYISGGAGTRLIPKMDREGLVENETYTTLRSILRRSLDWVALQYEAFLRAGEAKKHEETVESFEQAEGVHYETPKERVTAALSVLKASSSDNAKGRPYETKETSTGDHAAEPKSESYKLDKASQFIESQFDAYQAEIDTLRGVAATAPLLFVFAHEFKGIIASLSSQAARLEQIAKLELPDGVADELLSIASVSRQQALQHGRITSLFNVFSDSQNFNKKRRVAKPAVEQILSGFDYLLSEFKIEVEMDGLSPLLRVPKLNEAELFSILINGLTNAIKAVIAKQSNRKIRLQFTEESSYIQVNVIDNGVGLSEQHWDTVFDAFVSDPENRIYPVLSNRLGDEQLTTMGKGSGLGLHIMKSIIHKHGGRIRFEKAAKPWSTNLSIRIAK